MAQAVTVPAVGSSTSVSGTTVGFINDHVTNCAGGTTIGRDRVYSFVLPNTRRLRVSVTTTSSGWDHVVYFVRGPFSNCLPTGTICLASADATGPGTSETETTSYRNNTGSPMTVYVVIDSKNATAAGSYFASFNLDAS